MNLGAHSYPITVEEGALARVGSCFSLRSRVLILTDSGVPAAYAQAVADACAEPHLVTLEPGEANKCPDTWLSVLRIMLKAGFDRGDALVAVGGGVIWDLGGFVAATYMRGIEHGDEKDILGRTYEYCLSKFAEQEGKLAGEFYTPSCVVRTLVEVLQPYHGRVYDPCCGSGGMFVQSAKFVESHSGNINDISVYGQDSNPTTW